MQQEKESIHVVVDRPEPPDPFTSIERHLVVKRIDLGVIAAKAKERGISKKHDKSMFYQGWMACLFHMGIKTEE